MSKPIKLYSHATGPNPWKINILLEELGLKYETQFLDMQKEIKAKPYTDVNPNGRVPAIDDPNTGISLWESGAIIEYLIDTYDTSNNLSFASSPEKYQAKQFLHFQTSGQGPYFGQAAWFHKFHAEDVPSAKERYEKEIDRVTMVLNNCLEGKEYLVGNKCSYADLSFITWYTMVNFIFGGQAPDLNKQYPNYGAWMDRLLARPAVKKALADKKKAASG